MTSLTPYSESLERVRSVLVFFSATGPANAAVLAELESEVRAATTAGRHMFLSLEAIQGDLDQLAVATLADSAASVASRMMARWAEAAFDRVSRRVADSGEARP